MSTLPSCTDVLVVGAGPVGLLTALGLAQQGIDTVIIDKRTLESQEKLGRAVTLYPRTLELLEQSGVAGDVCQEAFIGRSYAVYSGGRHATRGAFRNMFPIMDVSHHNYITNIRQSASSRIFAARYHRDSAAAARGRRREVYHEWALEGFEVQGGKGDGCNVTARLKHPRLGEQTVRCKYLVGADGGQSSVRRMAGVEMEGNDTTYRWVRVDGLVKSDVPEPDVSFASVESPSHGLVLWAKLDRDAHRIGFSLSPRLAEKYPDGLTEEQAVHEAVEAMKPFKVEIERLDWFTHYTVKQKVASTFHKDEYIILAGDAAHTHSSAFAQGMNTGVHDATNLAWKLAGHLKGWYKPGVLATYADERREAAQKLIAIDRLAARAVSGDLAVQEGSGMTPQEAFRSVMETNLSFTTGLGVSYEPSLIGRETLATTLAPGTRSPDALLRRPGPAVQMRLHEVTHFLNRGRWTVLVFAGHPHRTVAAMASLRERIMGNGAYLGARTGDEGMLQLGTIMVGSAPSAWAVFGGPAIGNLYFDVEAVAHDRYGVYPDRGAIVIVRPDGVFSFATGLDGLDDVESFFGALLL